MYCSSEVLESTMIILHKVPLLRVDHQVWFANSIHLTSKFKHLLKMKKINNPTNLGIYNSFYSMRWCCCYCGFICMGLFYGHHF